MSADTNIKKFQGNSYPEEPIPRDIEIGETGLRESGGIIDEEFLRPLQWPNATRIYREMSSNDSVIGAVLFAIDQLTRGVSWDVKPGGNSVQEQERAEFIKECMNDIDKDWKEVVSEVMTMVVFGYSLLEPVFKRRFGPNQTDERFRSRFKDGLWSWRMMPIRAADSIDEWVFHINEDGQRRGLKGVWQIPPLGGKKTFIPIDRLLHFRLTSKKDNPESVSALRTSYRAWSIKRRIEEYEAIGIERDLAGIPVVRGPSQIYSKEANNSQKFLRKKLDQAAATLKANEMGSASLPSDRDERGNYKYDLELLASPGSKLFDTNAIIDRWDNRILQTMLADFIALGSKNVGSHAMSRNKTELFGVAINSWLDVVASVFNRKAIPDVFRMNGWDLESLPILEHTPIDSRDLTQISEYFSSLLKSGGVDPEPGLEKWLRKTGGAPDEVEDEEQLD